MSTSHRTIGGRTGAMMLRAVSRNELQTVERLLSRRGRSLLSVHGPDGCTPLLLACKKGHLDMVKLLMQHGAKITDRDSDGKRQGNALHYACWGGSLEVVHFLLQQGASPAETDIVGNTSLLYAVYGGHKHVVEDLLRRGRSLREKNNKNHTVILQAACGGHLELVEWLLQKGFSLAETDNDGNTALLFAAWGGHRELMEFLLRNGSSLQEKNHNGHSVFLSAANGGRVEIVEWLLQEGFDLHETNHNGDTALLLAAYGGHRRLVERLLELGANFEDRNGCGFTTLLSAANGGQLEMAAWLLSKGASLGEADNDGYTSLILAACGGNIDLVEFFLKRGASLGERNQNGDTALLLAAYCGHRDLVEWLLNHGSQLSEKNNTNMGVLISAANGGHLEVVKLLVERYNAFGLEDKDDGGYTPLLLAAQRGHLSVVQYLAAYGANIKARTSRHDNDAIALAMDSPEVQEYLRQIWDMKPMQVACEARLVDRVHALLETGLDPAFGYEGATPLQIASTTLVYPGAKPPCPELLRLLHSATQPWSPRTHLLFGERFRLHIFHTLKLSLLLARQPNSHLPILPHEIWLHIMSFNERRHFPEIVDPEAAWLDKPELVAARQRYRSGRLARRSLPSEEIVVSDLDQDDELLDELEDVDQMQRSALRNTASDRLSPVSVEAMTESSDAESDWRGKLVDIQEDTPAPQFQFHVTWV